jgi:chromosome segregation ATPase
MKSTLEGVEKDHAIAMEGLQAQLQKSLTSNTLLKEQLKDQERQNRQKQKEVEDLRKAAADFEKRQNGFNEVLDHFQKTLLGSDGSPYCVVSNNMLCRV